MLTQEFDRETMQYLSDILAQENTTCDELLCSLIRDRWLLLQQTVAASPAASRATHQAVTHPELNQADIAPASFVSPGFNLASSGVELLPSEVALLNAPVPPSGHRPRNPKQTLADFVKRRNQRLCVF